MTATTYLLIAVIIIIISSSSSCSKSILKINDNIIIVNTLNAELTENRLHIGPRFL